MTEECAGKVFCISNMLIKGEWYGWMSFDFTRANV